MTTCNKCDGSGTITVKCGNCGGSGTVDVEVGYQQTGYADPGSGYEPIFESQSCSNCTNGKIKSTCPSCKGKG